MSAAAPETASAPVVTPGAAPSAGHVHGQAKERLCKAMLRHDMVHIIASDAHGANGSRIPAMREAFHEATKILGSSATHLFQTNPQRIIEDQPLPKSDPRPIPQEEYRLH